MAEVGLTQPENLETKIQFSITSFFVFSDADEDHPVVTQELASDEKPGVHH